MKIPCSYQIDFNTGMVTRYPKTTERKLSEIRNCFYDGQAVERVLKKADPIIYEAYEVKSPNEEGLLSWCTTIIHPGCVGREYHMTKGHFHKKDISTEFYLGLKGKGLLIAQSRAGQFTSLEIRPGVMVDVPPSWAHRVVNTGIEELIVMAMFSSDAGHYYCQIEEKGFMKLVVKQDERYALIKNPRYGVDR